MQQNQPLCFPSQGARKRRARWTSNSRPVSTDISAEAAARAAATSGEALCTAESDCCEKAGGLATVQPALHPGSWGEGVAASGSAAERGSHRVIARSTTRKKPCGFLMGQNRSGAGEARRAESSSMNSFCQSVVAQWLSQGGELQINHPHLSDIRTVRFERPGGPGNGVREWRARRSDGVT